MVYLTKYLLQLIHHYMAKVPLDPDNVWQYCAVIGPIASPVKRLIGGRAAQQLKSLFSLDSNQAKHMGFPE